jgi:acetolactate synthase-1/2/3 large subunit
MNGGQAIVKTLIRHGITHTFGFPGGGIVTVFDALLDHKEKIRNILMRHEQCAAHAADGFARATGHPGVCIATSGPGASNLVTGMLTAWMDSSPIIAMAGQVSFRLIGHEAFQEVDMVDIALHTCKKDFQITDPDQILPTFNEAFRLSTQGRPGPVYIDLTKEAQIGNVTQKLPLKVRKNLLTFEGQEGKLLKIAKLVSKSSQPLILIGGGIIHSNASRELLKFADRTKIPVVRTLMAKGAFPDSSPLSLGMTGLYGSKTANYAVNRADLIIAIGCRFSNRTAPDPKHFAPNAMIVHIDTDQSELGENIQPDLGIIGDARLVLKRLIAVVQERGAKKGNGAWIKKLRELREKETSENINIDSKPIAFKRVFHELRKVIRDKDIVVTGVGCHQMMAGRYIEREYPRTFITSGGEGTMGFGLPASIGAKVGRPDVEVFNIDGDGSFQMTLEELAVLSYENIKVITIVCKNEYLGMVRQWQELAYGKDRYSSVHLGPMPDFVKLAKAYGVNGFRANTASEIAPCLEKAIKSEISSVIEIPIRKEENYLPTPLAISDEDF